MSVPLYAVMSRECYCGFQTMLSETERNADKRKAAPAEGRWDAWNPLVASSCLILTILKDITQLADNVSPSELGRKQWAKEEGGTKSE